MSPRLYNLLRKLSKKSSYHPSPSSTLEALNKNIISKIFTLLDNKEEKLLLSRFFNLNDNFLSLPEEINYQNFQKEFEPYILQFLPFVKDYSNATMERSNIKFNQLPTLKELNLQTFELNENYVRTLTLPHFYKSKLQKKEKKKLFGISNNLPYAAQPEKNYSDKMERDDHGTELIKNVVEGVKKNNLINFGFIFFFLNRLEIQ